MDKEGIRLLHWLRFRLFVNYLNRWLSVRLVRVGVYVAAFLATWAVMSFASVAGQIEPYDYVQPEYLELFGLSAILGAALLPALLSSLIMTLRMHEEDILLAIPIESRTIVQSRLIRTLYAAPVISFILAAVFLGFERSFLEIDILARLPYGFLSFLFFFLLCLGAFLWLASLVYRYPRIFSAVTYILAGIAVFLLGMSLYFLFNEPQKLAEFVSDIYWHPITRFFLAVPLSSAEIILFGGLNSRTLVEVLCLACLGLLFLNLVFRHRYELHEIDVSPYRATQGRGEERESPPLPELLERLRRVFRVRYLDIGTGSKAILGPAFSQSVKRTFALGLMILSFSFMLGWIFSFGSAAFLLYMMFFTPYLLFMSWMFGFFIGGANSMGLNTDILRMIPDTGRRILFYSMIPDLSLLGFFFATSAILLSVAFPTGLTIYVLMAGIFLVIHFVIGYVSLASVMVWATSVEARWHLEGEVRKPPILPVLLAIIPPIMLFVQSILLTAYRDIVNLMHVVLPLFLITSFSMLAAYLFYEKASRTLDSLGPR